MIDLPCRRSNHHISTVLLGADQIFRNHPPHNCAEPMACHRLAESGETTLNKAHRIIRLRAYRNKHLGAVLREHDISGPMSAAWQMTTDWKITDDHLQGSADVFARFGCNHVVRLHSNDAGAERNRRLRLHRVRASAR